MSRASSGAGYEPDRLTEITSLVARLVDLLAQQEAAVPSQPASPPVEQAKPRLLLTVEEAAERLHIGRTTAYALVRAGEIESVQIGRLRRISTTAVADYAARLIPAESARRKAA